MRGFNLEVMFKRFFSYVFLGILLKTMSGNLASEFKTFKISKCISKSLVTRAFLPLTLSQLKPLNFIPTNAYTAALLHHKWNKNIRKQK